MKLYNLLIVAITFFVFGSLQGQTTDTEFSKLSAKERSEIAQKETMEAARDHAFLYLMDQGHQLFVEKRYLESVRKYEDARALRPRNVYPPVIIRDIELSMKDTLQLLREKEKEEKPETPSARKEPELPDREKIMEEFRKKEAERQKKVDEWESSQRRYMARERALKEEEDQEQQELGKFKGRDVREASVEELQEELAREYSDGVTQRSYDDGQRKITERVVVRKGIGNAYKRVEHPWGGKFYFKNGQPISEETWNQETQP
jgi:hypothetical protein